MNPTESDREPSQELPRRRFLQSAVAVGAVVGTAGCGGDDRTPTATPPSDPTPTPDPEEPRVYAGLLDSFEVDAIRDRVLAGDDPWKRGYEAQIRDARRALDATPKSVVDNGAPEGVDPHRFATGETRADYQAALRMSHWIRDLGLGYVFSRENRYARKAIGLLEHWFLSPETRMYPSGRNFGETYFSIELHITVPTMIYGAALIGDHPYWEHSDGKREALEEWIRAYLTDLEAGREKDRYTGVVKNNIYAWWIFARAVAAAALEDRDALTSAFEDWRTNALDQLEPSGLLKHERQREDGLEYSLYGLKALTLTAEVARHYDVDLYGFELESDTSALQRAFLGHLPYVESGDGWEWGVGEEGYTDTERQAAGSIYELANSQWPQLEFQTVLESLGRPFYERRILGWTSLTHANQFALDLDRPANES